MADTQTNPTQPNKLTSKRAAQWTRQGLLNASLVALMTGVVLGKQLLLKPTLLQMGSPAGGYGWVPLPNPNPVPLPFGTGPTNYDWTGLDVASHLKWRDRDALDSTGKSYGGFYGYNYLDSSSSGGLIEYTSDVTGTSTFKWKWCPPLDPGTGQPDLTNFPAPPLYAVGRVSAYVSGNLTSPPRANGVSGHGSISYGLAAGDGGSFDSVPGRVPGDAQDELQRAVVGPAALDGTDADGFPVYRIGVSPSLHVSLTASVPGAPLNGGGRIGVDAPNIKLTAPDPMKRPDTLGDGGNQFVFNSESGNFAIRWLEVPVAAVLSGGTEDDAKHLIGYPNGPSRVDWKVEPGIATTSGKPSPVTYKQTVSGSIISVQTQGTEPRGSMWRTGQFIFDGLPNSFSKPEDGNHTVTLTVDGNNSTPAHVQVFYTGTAKNNPLDSFHDIRNWFAYYFQAFHPTGSDGGKLAYTDFDGRSHIKVYPPYELRIANDAYQTGHFYEVNVFDTDPQTHFVRLVGFLKLKGISMYAFVSAHEITHHDLSLRTGAQQVYQWGEEDQNGNINPGTSDMDNVVNDWEDRWKVNGYPVLDSGKGDTANAYANAGEPGDDEALADIGALGVLFSQATTLWKQDWAAEPSTSSGGNFNGGLQYGPLYWYSTRIATPPVFYWEFQPKDRILIEGQPRPEAIRLPNGSYSIRSLDDLKALHPRVLTGVPASV